MVEEVITRYQNGDPSAAEELIAAFEPLIFKYMRILRGTVDFGDRDAVSFISLFIGDPSIRKKLLSKKPPWKAKKVAQDVATMLSKCLSQLEHNELYNELCLSLLELARRYRDEGRTFTAYISGAYRYEVYRKVINYLKDPVAFATLYDGAFEPANVDEPELLDEHLLGKLTQLEKHLLFERYLKGMGVREIARQTGYAPGTISKKINSAKVKLRSASVV